LAYRPAPSSTGRNNLAAPRPSGVATDVASLSHSRKITPAP